MFLSQRNAEALNYRVQDIKKLRSSFERVLIMNEIQKTLTHVLLEHHATTDYLQIELVKDVLEVVSLDGVVRLEQEQKLLDELWCTVVLDYFLVYESA